MNLTEEEQTILAKKAGHDSLPPHWDVEMNWTDHENVVARLSDRELQVYFHKMQEVGKEEITSGRKMRRSILTVGGFLMAVDLEIRARVLFEIVSMTPEGSWDREDKPHRADGLFADGLTDLVKSFLHPDWDITASQIIGQLELAKSTIISMLIGMADEDPEPRGSG